MSEHDKKFKVTITTWGYYNPSYILQTDGKLVQWDYTRDKSKDALFTEAGAEYMRNVLAENGKYSYQEIFVFI